MDDCRADGVSTFLNQCLFSWFGELFIDLYIERLEYVSKRNSLPRSHPDAYDQAEDTNLDQEAEKSLSRPEESDHSLELDANNQEIPKKLPNSILFCSKWLSRVT